MKIPLKYPFPNASFINPIIPLQMANILLIEDEEPIRRVMVKILIDENKSYQITEASHGKEGLEKLTRDNFDLILCDL